MGWAAAAVLWITGRWIVAAVLAVLGFWMVLQVQMDVPDASSPVMANHLGMVDAEDSVGQTFVSRWDNLDRITLAIASLKPNDYSSITFTIRDGGPSGPVLRTVKELVSNLPVGDAFIFSQDHPGIMNPRWHSFDFEPIPDSAGRKLFFSVEGKYLPPQNKVGIAMMFHSGYPQGTAYVNGGEQNAHVVFRAESWGNVPDYLAVLAGNLTFGKQGPLANPATYVALGIVYVVLLGALLRTAWHALRG